MFERHGRQPTEAEGQRCFADLGNKFEPSSTLKRSTIFPQDVSLHMSKLNSSSVSNKLSFDTQKLKPWKNVLVSKVLLDLNFVVLQTNMAIYLKRSSETMVKCFFFF